MGENVTTLQSPFRFTTHYNLHTRRTWEQAVNGHRVEITWMRPRLFAGFRKATCSVAVDGAVVAEATGR